VTCEVQEKTIAELKSTIAQQQRAIEQLATQIQKVNAQVQLNGATPRQSKIETKQHQRSLRTGRARK
jgi:uncharacterized coiled-coil protein SlyX